MYGNKEPISFSIYVYIIYEITQNNFEYICMIFNTDIVSVAGDISNIHQRVLSRVVNGDAIRILSPRATEDFFLILL